MPRLKLPALPEGAKCHYCGEPADTWDHVVPFAKGGKNRHWNRIPACRDCNVAKAARWPACPCDFCVNACEQFFEERQQTIGAVYRFGPQQPAEVAETKPGLPLETVEQLTAWLARMS